jgi:hypothetical protein
MARTTISSPQQLEPARLVCGLLQVVEGEIMFRLAIVSSSLVVAVFAIASAIPSVAQKQDSQDKHIDIQSSVGDVHLGTDADARKAGLSLYPGARPHHDENENNGVNLGVLTEAFGLKLVVAKYDSDDAPAKIIDFYREGLKKYGKVLECRRQGHAGEHADFDDDDDNKKSKELKCEGDNSGPVTELKVGTGNNQHVVAIEPNNGKSGATFALVYVHTRGKQGDL